VREDGAGAARQDSGEPVLLTPELSVSDREHAAVEAKKAASADPLLDARVPNAGSEHLGTRNHAVLPRRNGAQAPIHRGLVAFSFHLTG
jgi:hypothetical protein